MAKTYVPELIRTFGETNGIPPPYCPIPEWRGLKDIVNTDGIYIQLHQIGPMFSTMDFDRQMVHIWFSYLALWFILFARPSSAGVLQEITITAKEIADCEDRGTREISIVGNKIRKVNRTTHLYSARFVLTRELNDSVKVTGLVGTFGNGGWKTTTSGLDLGLFCSMVKLYAPQLLKNFGEFNGIPAPYCPMPAGNYTVEGVNARQKVYLPFVPPDLYRIDFVYTDTRTGKRLGCKRALLDVPPRKFARQSGFLTWFFYVALWFILLARPSSAGVLGETVITTTEIADCDDRGTNEVAIIGNRIRKINRTTHLYSAKFIIPKGINNNYMVTLLVASFGNGGWKRSTTGLDLGRFCGMVKTYAPNIIKEFGETNGVPSPYCPVPPGNYTVTDMSTKLKVNLPFVPANLYRMDFVFSRAGIRVGCKRFTFNIPHRRVHQAESPVVAGVGEHEVQSEAAVGGEGDVHFEVGVHVGHRVVALRTERGCGEASTEIGGIGRPSRVKIKSPRLVILTVITTSGHRLH
ncbi:hypothetical protein AAG570_003047 [Ranatra chinensis]|uniref:MD-2-related lipid-recognition domain-containing protein n=1 Tax=Ranatra chinensis TaxID=642074 RepID=A0ABD0Y5M4_9HEMI